MTSGTIAPRSAPTSMTDGPTRETPDVGAAEVTIGTVTGNDGSVEGVEAPSVSRVAVLALPEAHDETSTTRTIQHPVHPRFTRAVLLRRRPERKRPSGRHPTSALSDPAAPIGTRRGDGTGREYVPRILCVVVAKPGRFTGSVASNWVHDASMVWPPTIIQRRLRPDRRFGLSDQGDGVIARERWSGPADIADRSNATFREIGDLIRCHLREVNAQEHSEADRGRTVLSDACRELLEPVQALLGRVGFVQ